MRRKTNKNHNEFIKNIEVPHYEAMQRLLVNVAFLAKERNVKVLAVTSWQEEEGRTSTAVHLAHTMAKTTNARVLLIDLDLRKPDVHRYFGLTNNLGIADFCLSNVNPIKIVHNIHYNLDVIPNGQIKALYSKIVLTSERLKTLIHNSKNVYDYIIIDTPPLKLFADAFYLARIVDASLFVIDANMAKRKNINESFQALRNAYMPVLGTILTGTKRPKKNTYKKYRL